MTYSTLPASAVLPYAAEADGEDDGWRAADDEDRGITQLADVASRCDTSDANDVGYLFGFVSGLSQRWEGLNLVDVVPR